MEKAKNLISVVIVCVTILVCIVICTVTFKNYKAQASGNGVTVTGSATHDFTSDLIVWRGSFSRDANTSKEAYTLLKADADAVNKYLTDNGIKESEIVFSSVDINQKFSTELKTDDSGNKTEVQVPSGYTLTQNVAIKSNEVDKVESVSRDITKLIDSGVDFLSSPPEYYYTKLDELKLQMITDATTNARKRAEIVATNANSQLTKLGDASLGVFQITAQNSADAAFDYMGSFDTSSKEKTASVTVKLHYALK